MHIAITISYNNLLNGLSIQTNPYLYRYIKFDHLNEWYKSKEMYLCKPSKWDDPFENIILEAPIKYGESFKFLNHRKQVYGQCWTYDENENDAFWRIFSHYKNYVRIRIRTKDFWDNLYLKFLKESDLSKDYGLFLGKVIYKNRNDLVEYVKDLKVRQKMASLVNKKLPLSLLLKPIEFKHEKEIRLIFYDFHFKFKGRDEISLTNIDPTQLINEIVFDPRIDEKLYIKRKTRLSKYCDNISKSSLYSLPEDLFTLFDNN